MMKKGPFWILIRPYQRFRADLGTERVFSGNNGCHQPKSNFYPGLPTLIHFAWDSKLDHLSEKCLRFLPHIYQSHISYHWAKIGPFPISRDCPNSEVGKSAFTQNTLLPFKTNNERTMKTNAFWHKLTSGRRLLWSTMPWRPLSNYPVGRGGLIGLVSSLSTLLRIA